MWYSSFSTGVFDVDNQHANIEALTKLFEKDDEPGNEQKWLDMISKTLQLHFDFEEKVFENNMSEEHFEEHRRLSEHVTMKFKMRQRKEISKSDLITLIRGLLLNHVIDFDCKFKEVAVRDGSHYRHPEPILNSDIDLGYKFKDLN